MANIYDEEDLLNEIHSHVKDNLNTKISAINTEKGDFNIDTITEDNKHFIFAGETLELPNNMFVEFSFDGQIDIKTNKTDFISIPNITIIVAFDNQKKPNTYFKSLRYMRALYETILDFESSAIEADGLQLTKLVPMTVTLQGRQLVVSGIGISVAIG